MYAKENVLPVHVHVKLQSTSTNWASAAPPRHPLLGKRHWVMSDDDHAFLYLLRSYHDKVTYSCCTVLIKRNKQLPIKTSTIHKVQRYYNYIYYYAFLTSPNKLMSIYFYNNGDVR